MYTVSPYTHMTLPYKHLVSGVITTCGFMHHKIARAMYSRAKEYMDHMEALEAKMGKPLTCHLEQVRLLETDCPAPV